MDQHSAHRLNPASPLPLWKVGECGQQLATIVEARAPERIVAYVVLPEDERRAEGLVNLALLTAAPEFARVMTGLALATCEANAGAALALAEESAQLMTLVARSAP